MSGYARILVHLGSGEEGRLNEVALKHYILRQRLDYGEKTINVSNWLRRLAEQERDLMTKVPADYPDTDRLTLEWLEPLPGGLIVWRLPDGNFVATIDPPEGAEPVNTVVELENELDK